MANWEANGTQGTCKLPRIGRKAEASGGNRKRKRKHGWRWEYSGGRLGHSEDAVGKKVSLRRTYMSQTEANDKVWALN